MKISQYIIFVFCAVFFSSCSQTTVRHMENYDQRLKPGAKVAILPPAVEVATVDFSGNQERMHDYEMKMESVIARELKPLLEEKGFLPQILTRREIYEKGLSEKIAQLREEYHHIREELYGEKTWPQEKASKIEKKVSVDLKGITDASFLIFVDYAGVSKTTGSKLLSSALSIFGLGKSEAADANMMILGSIDSVTGEVVWMNSGKMENSVIGAAWDSMLSDDEVDSNISKKLINQILDNMSFQN